MIKTIGRGIVVSLTLLSGSKLDILVKSYFIMAKAQPSELSCIWKGLLSKGDRFAHLNWGLP